MSKKTTHDAQVDAICDSLSRATSEARSAVIEMGSPWAVQVIPESDLTRMREALKHLGYQVEEMKAMLRET